MRMTMMNPKKNTVYRIRGRAIWTAAALIAAILIALLLAACGEETFICHHCLEEKYEVPHHALVKSTKFPSGIDMTLCRDCYDSYQRGEWELP